MFRPEILAPAGDLFKLKTAIRYGADAVYSAGHQFGLRSGAKNLSPAEIEEGCRFAHAHGAKLYLALNGFLFDEELRRMPPFLARISAAGVDAVIVSDLGVLETVKRHSSLVIHLSTQASTLNTMAAKFWRKQGVRRIVLGREVSIERAAAIKKGAGVEVELFVHGAMCMAYSGHCTISNYTAGRDSNRGGCIQSCRFQYRLGRERGGRGPTDSLLSSKDLRGLEHLQRLAELEIDSLKIEGRMKSPLYVATTARTYVRAYDLLLKDGFERERRPLLDELDSMSHRAYSSGNLRVPAGPDSVDRGEGYGMNQGHEMLGHIVGRVAGKHLAVLLKNPLKPGERVELLATDGGAHRIDTSRMRRLDGTPIREAHPNWVVLLEDHEAAAPQLLLRKRKHVAPDHLAFLAV